MLSPELLADVLGRVIAGRGVEVIRLPVGEETAEEGPDEPPSGVDVAVVSEEPPPEGVPAEIVVWLPEGGLHTWGAGTEVLVTAPHGEANVEVADLDGLVELIVKLTADC